ncbi:hypothetical protein MIND_00785300 [Mycena indigotica]|uniref:Uncharacterized protein n=1 Tax=Mycena indigotica TaxID=2126181 RepID=A0A8H6W7K2_9AGAR|nr:uncharacterized protein MIND_00785300 [Mycena indigotica]KAF7302184.1 hypothetical protein MIND_00785300 [Mycena indigotica]
MQNDPLLPKLIPLPRPNLPAGAYRSPSPSRRTSVAMIYARPSYSAFKEMNAADEARRRAEFVTPELDDAATHSGLTPPTPTPTRFPSKQARVMDPDSPMDDYEDGEDDQVDEDQAESTPSPAHAATDLEPVQRTMTEEKAIQVPDPDMDAPITPPSDQHITPNNSPSKNVGSLSGDAIFRDVMGLPPAVGMTAADAAKVAESKKWSIPLAAEGDANGSGLKAPLDVAVEEIDGPQSVLSAARQGVGAKMKGRARDEREERKLKADGPSREEARTTSDCVDYVTWMMLWL